MKFKKLLLPLLCLISLSSCGLFADLIEGAVGNDDPSQTKITATSADATFDKYLANVDMKTLPTKGDQKMLVLPIKFSGENLVVHTSGNEKVYARTSNRTLIDIHKAFFGSTEDTGWESVSSYYNKASYGQLNITGEVAPWFEPTYSIEDLLTGKVGSQRNDPTYVILEDAVNHIKETNSIDLTKYDQNQDGFIDSIFMVYNVCYNDYAFKKYDLNNLFWAFTFWDFNTTGSLSSPNPNVYAWASAEFMNDGGYIKPDAHTYIHESGHIMGLDDYYTYDENDYGPVGGLDMMDYNIGDHNSFSKSLLGWVEPRYINREGTITIKPFESSGDCLLIKPGWLGSLLDEYLLVEYYTPTGLNYRDSHIRYPGRDLLFKNNGIRVFHVDARLAKVTTKWNSNVVTYNGITDKIVNSTNSVYGETTYTEFANNNTNSKGFIGNKLLSIIDGGKPMESLNRTKKGQSATDDFLYHEGTGFYYNGNHTNFIFNNGTTPDFGFEVINLTPSVATLRIFKTA